MPGVESSATPVFAGSNSNCLLVECAPSRAANSPGDIPFSSKSLTRLSALSRGFGRRPSGFPVERSIRPTNVLTVGPRGQVTTA
jgi:hypothetical protein